MYSIVNAGGIAKMIGRCCCRDAAYSVVLLQGLLLLLMVIVACSTKLGNLGAACPCKLIGGYVDLIVQVACL